jgi:hypothetical protein
MLEPAVPPVLKGELAAIRRRHARGGTSEGMRRINADNSAYVSIGAGDRFSWLSTGLLLLDYPCAAS